VSLCLLQVIPEIRQAMQFTQTFYQFDVPGDAKVGDVVGHVWVMVPWSTSSDRGTNTST